MTNDHEQLADELFARICRCLDFDDLDLKFVVHRTKGKWFDMKVFPVGEGNGNVVFDVKKLLNVFDGNFFAGSLHLAEDHKLSLTGRLGDNLFRVTFRQEQHK